MRSSSRWLDSMYISIHFSSTLVWFIPDLRFWWDGIKTNLKLLSFSVDSFSIVYLLQHSISLGSWICTIASQTVLWGGVGHVGEGTRWHWQEHWGEHAEILKSPTITQLFRHLSLDFSMVVFLYSLLVSSSSLPPSLIGNYPKY